MGHLASKSVAAEKPLPQQLRLVGLFVQLGSVTATVDVVFELVELDFVDVAFRALSDTFGLALIM